MRLIIPIIVGLVVAGAAYAFNLTLKLGAHPFWADQVIFWGAPIGVLLAVVSLRLPYVWRVLGFAVLTGFAFAVAYAGKTRFAASYAEDAVAGQMWFFGWHGVCILAMATIVAALSLRPT